MVVETAVMAESLGWRGAWCSELFGLDALTVLGAVAARTTDLRLGTAALPATTRSAALLAMGGSTLAQLAPGRVVLGIGASTPAVVTDRHDRPLHRPLAEIAGILEVLRAAARGETVNHASAPAVRNLRIESAPTPPKLFLAASGPRLIELATSSCDGLLLNMVPFPLAVSQGAAAATAAPGFETALLVRTYIEPTEENVARLRDEVAGYLRVPAYGAALTRAGIDVAAVVNAPDRRTATGLVDDRMLEQFVCVGSADTCRANLTELQRAGLSVLVVPPADPAALRRTVVDLAPTP
jgi:alkanesulfonate monooxygenase SsuD/methylene tetrahydromethanopterin reductase-like flavin-dependent oxidoreductase (luciferase family)